jgi:hypothetical protein
MKRPGVRILLPPRFCSRCFGGASHNRTGCFHGCSNSAVVTNPFKVGDKIVTKVRGAEVEAVVTSTWADGHAPNVEFGALEHRGDGADDRVRELGDWFCA